MNTPATWRLGESANDATGWPRPRVIRSVTVCGYRQASRLFLAAVANAGLMASATARMGISRLIELRFIEAVRFR